jgi:pimeloyl-ACP methyl ester carboxylesterase
MKLFCACGTCALLVTAFVLLLVSRSAEPQTNQGSAITFTTCAVPNVDGPVRCARFEVPEDRAKPGRMIGLNIVVLEATGPSRKPDPIVPLQGGPGQGATQQAEFYAQIFASLRRDHDIVLIDSRGTGRSNPLECDISTPDALRSPDLLPPATIEGCRKVLESRADLSAYTTSAFTKDLDAVRTAMRIEQWNLFGGSYGTRLAQEYIRRFAPRVRTATLTGIAAPSLMIPLSYARDAQAALEASFDSGTQKAFTDVLATLRGGPVKVTVEGAEVTVSEGLLAESVRSLLYSTNSVQRIRNIIATTAAGDFSAAGASVLRTKRNFSRDIALGLYLSVTCAEDIPMIDPARVPDAVRNTFLGDFRIRQQIGACHLWRSGTAPAEVFTPVVSDVPILLFSGDRDPVTPPSAAEEVVRTLRNGRHIVLPNTGHAFGITAPCIVSMMTTLLKTAETKTVDVSCASGTR